MKLHYRVIDNDVYGTKGGTLYKVSFDNGVLEVYITALIDIAEKYGSLSQLLSNYPEETYREILLNEYRITILPRDNYSKAEHTPSVKNVTKTNNDEWALMHTLIPPALLVRLIKKVEDGVINRSSAKIVLNGIFEQNIAKFST